MVAGLNSVRLLQFDLTGHQMFAMPFLHVFLQRAVDAEGHVADVAAVHILSKLPVGLHVACQLGALGAGVAAQVAFVGPFARVAASVHRQVAAVLEDLATVLAGVIPPILRAGGPAGSGSPQEVRSAAATAARGTSCFHQLSGRGAVTEAPRL